MAFAIDDAIAAGLRIIEKYVPDPNQRAKAEAELRNDIFSIDRGQLEVNKVEAAHLSLFVAGWRPAIGWSCACALAFQYLLYPLASWVGFMVGHPIPKPPAIDEVLWQLMFGMLGFGGLRTYEKIKGVSR